MGIRIVRGGFDLSESELYKELGILTKDKSKWEENIPFVLSLLDHESVKIKAKALCLQLLHSVIVRMLF